MITCGRQSYFLSYFRQRRVYVVYVLGSANFSIKTKFKRCTAASLCICHFAYPIRLCFVLQNIFRSIKIHQIESNQSVCCQWQNGNLSLCICKIFYIDVPFSTMADDIGSCRFRYAYISVPNQRWRQGRVCFQIPGFSCGRFIVAATLCNSPASGPANCLSDADTYICILYIYIIFAFIHSFYYSISLNKFPFRHGHFVSVSFSVHTHIYLLLSKGNFVSFVRMTQKEYMNINSIEISVECNF